MSSKLKDALAALKAALNELKPAGSDGFEGLLAEILNEITRQDFRLASSGLQLGIDGETLAGLNHIAFEGKLYSGSINKNEVLTKITSIISKPSPPDVWVLGASVEANTQLLEQMQPAAKKNGIATLILDWPKASTIPPLAAACAMAAGRTHDFLKAHVADKPLVEKAKAALKVIANDTSFSAASGQMAGQLAPASLGIPIALERNASWLNNVFANPAEARMQLGQRLAPTAKWPLPTQPRQDLVRSIQEGVATFDAPKIVAILGSEGVGKSWIVAQSWQASPKPPVTVIVPAIDILPDSLTDFEGFLIGKLVEQTDDVRDDYTRNRWGKRFDRWRDLPPPERPRVVLCVDGLNQHANFDWPRWLDGAASKLARIGGLLLVTDRRGHFNTRLRGATTSRVEPFTVEEWTSDELLKILEDEGIDAAPLRDEVLKLLRNPRILGIAFELRALGRTHSFEELSVARLLFEHIRAGQRDGHAHESAAKFSKRLAQHAQEVIERTKSQQRDDRLVFEVDGRNRFELESGLLAVSSEHYFHALSDDETLYRITDEGLPYALGLSIIEDLKAAKRNERDLVDALAQVLEPIAALDRTAETVLTAVQIAGIDETCAPEIAATLQTSYVQLQNVDDDTYPTFAASLRARPEAAIQAIEFISGLPGRVTRGDWLVEAAREARSNPEAWNLISVHLKRWLSRYSLAPELQVYSRRNEEAEKYDAELAASQERISGVMNVLSDKERSFINEHMLRDDSINPADLNAAAFELLAGMPLADFAKAFVAWAIGNAANSSFRSSDNTFANLIRFNSQDWAEAREAILKEAAFLGEEGASRTAKWALVSLLRATATPEDSAREKKLVDELTADREQHESWRLVERYCAVDPCDPASEEPEGIDTTADKYAELKEAPLNAGEGMTQDDHFFEDAMPGLARFRPEAAVGVIRRLAMSTKARSGRPLFLALIALEPHSAALDVPSVEALIEVAKTHAAPREEGDSDDEWISAQYALASAFPHLSGEDQLALLSELPRGNSPLLKLLETVKPAAADALEAAFGKVLNGHTDQKLAIITFAAQPGQILTGTSRHHIGKLATDDDRIVRGEALALIVQLDDKVLLRQVVDSGWSASPHEGREKGFEIWHGSKAILRAAKHGFLTPTEAINRISFRSYGTAAYELGTDVGAEIATRLTAAFQRTLDANITKVAPRAEQEISLRPSAYPAFYSLSNAPDDEGDSNHERFRRMGETPEEFKRKQREAWEAFKEFERELTRQQAGLIIEDVSPIAIRAAMDAVPAWGSDTARTLLNAPQRSLYHAGNFGLRLACELSATEPALARELYERFSGRSIYLNIVYGPQGIPLEAFCAWGAADNSHWDAVRRARLDSAATDDNLAVEVLAALLKGKSASLEQYAAELLARAEPVAIARGLMVLGFGEPSEFAANTIAKYEKIGGFIGTAAEQARYVYERNVWSRHWYRLMGDANSAEDYWRWSVLLRKIVDGRFSLWERTEQKDIGPADLFDASLEAGIQKRIKGWKSKREKTLLGHKVPASVFLRNK